MENFRGLVLFTPCNIRSRNHIHKEMLTIGLERVWILLLAFSGHCGCCAQVLTLHKKQRDHLVTQQANTKQSDQVVTCRHTSKHCNQTVTLQTHRYHTLFAWSSTTQLCNELTPWLKLMHISTCDDSKFYVQSTDMRFSRTFGEHSGLLECEFWVVPDVPKGRSAFIFKGQRRLTAEHDPVSEM